MQDQELDLVLFVAPLHLRLFCDSTINFWEKLEVCMGLPTCSAAHEHGVRASMEEKVQPGLLN